MKSVFLDLSIVSLIHASKFSQAGSDILHHREKLSDATFVHLICLLAAELDQLSSQIERNASAR